MVSSKGLLVDNSSAIRKAESTAIAADDDIEEGVNIANTQKIPISLIK
jgi:hypothetical protein